MFFGSVLEFWPTCGWMLLDVTCWRIQKRTFSLDNLFCWQIEAVTATKVPLSIKVDSK